MNNPNTKPQHSKGITLTKNQMYTALGIVLVLAVFVCIFSYAPLAKFINSATGNDGARVARFEVNTTSTQTGDDLGLQLGYTTSTASYKFTVSNVDSSDNSILNEVETNYDVIITFPSAFADTTITPTLTNSAKVGTQSPTASTDKLTYTFTKAGTFAAASGATHTLELTFNIPDTVLSGTLTPTEWANVKVQVKATQVD